MPAHGLARFARAPRGRMPPPATEREARTRHAGVEPARFVGLLPLLTAHLQDRPCSVCGAVSPSFDILADHEVVCVPCGRQESDGDVVRRRGVDEEHYARRLSLTGLADEARIVETLGLAAETPDPPLSAAGGRGARHFGAVVAARRYEQAARRGLMMLGGPSGCGKSTAAAWLAWRSHGVFLPRREWTKVVVRGRDVQRLEWLVSAGGVVVLDDVMAVRPGTVAGDSEIESEIVFQIAVARHEAGRATVLTTQASYDEIVTAYGSRGEALLRRAEDGHGLDGEPDGGGWVEC